MNNFLSITFKPRLLSLISIAFIPLVILGGCTAESTSEAESGVNSDGVPVTVTTVRSQKMERTLSEIGTLRADTTVRISPEISGRIQKIFFREGETVDKGQKLVQLQDEKLQEQLQARKYALEEAEARLANARRTYDRNKRLRDQDMISAQELDNSMEAYESAKARVSRLKSEVQEARERLDDSTIKAPFSGSIGAREVDEGNFVRAGTTISTLYRMNPLVVQFSIPERFLGDLNVGQTVRVHVTSYPDRIFEGKVGFISPSVNSQTRDFAVKAQVSNPENLLKPGSFARVEVVVETLRDRPVIPAEALIPTREGPMVFVVKDGVAKRRSVQVGLRKPGLVEVEGGLETGETVVQTGHMSVSDGSAIRRINSP